MLRTVFLAALVCACFVTSAAHARSRYGHHHRHHVASHDPRPHAWCGWQLRQWLGVTDRRGNQARWWAGFGSRAHGPAVGTIVVWPHHVGMVTGRTSNGQWIVKSGNDGHRIRERPRSLSRAIAFRWPHGQLASHGWLQ